jgi:hypothetical protein
MSARFADHAARLAGLAGALFGWRPDEFWTATPEELAALVGALRGEAGEVGSPADLARLREQYPDG